MRTLEARVAALEGAGVERVERWVDARGWLHFVRRDRHGVEVARVSLPGKDDTPSIASATLKIEVRHADT